MRSFDSLSEREILALAIQLEEEDARVFAAFATRNSRDAFVVGLAASVGAGIVPRRSRKHG